MARLYIVLATYLVVLNLQAQPHRDVREEIFIHPNSQVFVAGETLRFSAYTLSHLSGEISALSKILYVQLVGENGSVVEQKVMLEKGRGSGEIFVNSLLPSGRYQLLAYTRWMRNFNDYFQLPLTIINPFEATIPKSINDSLLQIHFYHPNDYLIEGVKSEIGFRVKLPEGYPPVEEGKLIDARGAVLQTFRPGATNAGRFEFKPKAKEDYQVLLTDESGSISFHKFLPIEAAGYEIQVDRRSTGFEFTPVAVNRSVQELSMNVYHVGALWESRQVAAGEPEIFKDASLPKAIFHVSLHESGRLVYSRSVMPLNPIAAVKHIGKMQEFYGYRDSIQLQVELKKGQYSISIQQKSETLSESVIKADQRKFWKQIDHPFSDQNTPPLLEEDKQLFVAIHKFRSPKLLPDSVALLPELRNELFTATLAHTGVGSINDVEVALSFPAEVPLIKTANTDQEGKVQFSHPPLYEDQEAYLSVLDHEPSWHFSPENKFMTIFPPFDYSMKALDSLDAVEIKKRSIDNQIMNAFRDKRPKKAQEAENVRSPITQWNFEYQLDDYQRFPDFKEYFVEYILGAGIRNGGIHIRKEYYRPDFQNQQLVLLDGVPVSPERILELDPYLVEKVSVLNNRTFLGASVFDGVVLAKTYDNDLAGYEPVAATRMTYQGISPASEAFSGLETQLEKKPDRRTHLYWNPMLDWRGGTFELKSITSDVSGVFEVRIEGFSTDGEPISISGTFEVR